METNAENVCSLLEWVTAASAEEIAGMNVDRVTDPRDKVRVIEA